MNRNQQRSTAAVVVTTLYLLALVASVVIMLMTINTTAMSGIFLILLSMPWSLLLTWFQDFLSIDSVIFKTFFLVSGGLLNSFILYKLLSLLMNRFRR